MRLIVSFRVLIRLASVRPAAVNSVFILIDDVDIDVRNGHVIETMNFNGMFIKSITLVLVDHVTLVVAEPFKKETIGLADIHFVTEIAGEFINNKTVITAQVIR